MYICWSPLVADIEIYFNKVFYKYTSIHVYCNPLYLNGNDDLSMSVSVRDITQRLILFVITRICKYFSLDISRIALRILGPY